MSGDLAAGVAQALRDAKAAFLAQAAAAFEQHVESPVTGLVPSLSALQSSAAGASVDDVASSVAGALSAERLGALGAQLSGAPPSLGALLRERLGACQDALASEAAKAAAAALELVRPAALGALTPQLLEQATAVVLPAAAATVDSATAAAPPSSSDSGAAADPAAKSSRWGTAAVQPAARKRSRSRSPRGTSSTRGGSSSVSRQLPPQAGQLFPTGGYGGSSGGGVPAAASAPPQAYDPSAPAVPPAVAAASSAVYGGGVGGGGYQPQQPPQLPGGMMGAGMGMPGGSGGGGMMPGMGMMQGPGGAGGMGMMGAGASLPMGPGGGMMMPPGAGGGMQLPGGMGMSGMGPGGMVMPQQPAALPPAVPAGPPPPLVAFTGQPAPQALLPQYHPRDIIVTATTTAATNPMNPTAWAAAVLALAEGRDMALLSNESVEVYKDALTYVLLARAALFVEWCRAHESVQSAKRRQGMYWALPMPTPPSSGSAAEARSVLLEMLGRDPMLTSLMWLSLLADCELSYELRPDVAAMLPAQREAERVRHSMPAFNPALYALPRRAPFVGGVANDALAILWLRTDYYTMAKEQVLLVEEVERGLLGSGPRVAGPYAEYQLHRMAAPSRVWSSAPPLQPLKDMQTRLKLAIKECL